ncbi:GNAT family N-acetyltransferase [cf. Phormidesmis sp. LEGE 11477]|uniref:GNAT family N-acetyltransferase n=1 Tax=cf. Phormidesmis sp. LEGE 11477 TaxID=1828680 RepID=UPI00187F9D6E|nr:GNAT family N-acetyltransferase [cf. Phormidesmis sp. LEGE 11477]MBE9059492.1 GNAT family N-acetyltransferase [cf. Phormidesmis sp. LEGE 11477]
MQLETQRLIIRQWHPVEDVRNAMDIFGDAKVMRWIEDSQDSSLRQVQGRLQRYRDSTQKSKDGTGSWAVIQKDIGRVIGHVALLHLLDLPEVRPDHVVEPILNGTNTDDYIEIGWHFRPASWGFGYATESARALAEYGFQALNLSLLLAIAHPKNKRSIALIKRLGMQYDGVTTRYYGGQSLCLYRLSASSYRQAKITSP